MYFWICVVELRHVGHSVCSRKYYTLKKNHKTDPCVNIHQYLLEHSPPLWWNQQLKGCLHHFGFNILRILKCDLEMGRKVLAPAEVHEIICSSSYCVLSPWSEPLGKSSFQRKLKINFASVMRHFCKLPYNGYKMKFPFLLLPIINHSGRENIMLTLLFHVIVLLEGTLFNPQFSYVYITGCCVVLLPWAWCTQGCMHQWKISHESIKEGCNFTFCRVGCNWLIQ